MKTISYTLLVLSIMLFISINSMGETIYAESCSPEDLQLAVDNAEDGDTIILPEVDGFIIETITDLREGVIGLKACKDSADLPVILSLSFASTEGGGTTMMGNTVEETAKAAEEGGADAVGANCGDLGPDEMAEIAKMFKDITNIPIIIQPNAGKPLLKDGETIFAMGPEEFADGIMKSIENGAGLVGGCCGTSPDHIRAVAERIR